MNQDSYSLIFSKDRFKFSSAHITIFEDGTAENLHGHNYRVSLEIFGEELNLGMLFDPQVIKEKLDQICSILDEKVLLPELNEQISVISKNKSATEFDLFSKSYQIPSEDIVWLPVNNITMENLANYFAMEISEEIKRNNFQKMIGLRVEIAETVGQAASRTIHL